MRHCCALGLRWPPGAAAPRPRSRPPTASPNTARCSRTATRPNCSRPRAKTSGRHKRGPKNASLEQLRPGQGARRRQGRLRRAAALFRRHRAGAGPRDRACVTCMETLQGFNAAEIAKTPFDTGEQDNVTALATWIAGRIARHAASTCRRGTPRSAGPTRSASASSSSAAARTTSPAPPATARTGKRIRLQDLPDLTKNPGDGVGFAAWPAYRVSSGEMWSMQRRLNDCFRQQRFPYPRLRVGRDDRAGHLHGRQRQGRRVDRAGPQALNGATA